MGRQKQIKLQLKFGDDLDGSDVVCYSLSLIYEPGAAMIYVRLSPTMNKWRNSRRPQSYRRPVKLVLVSFTARHKISIKSYLLMTNYRRWPSVVVAASPSEKRS